VPVGLQAAEDDIIGIARAAAAEPGLGGKDEARRGERLPHGWQPRLPPGRQRFQFVAVALGEPLRLCFGAGEIGRIGRRVEARVKIAEVPSRRCVGSGSECGGLRRVPGRAETGRHHRSILSFRRYPGCVLADKRPGRQRHAGKRAASRKAGAVRR